MLSIGWRWRAYIAGPSWPGAHVDEPLVRLSEAGSESRGLASNL
jgi:hypothetical protein